MSVWSRLGEIFSSATADAFSNLLEGARSVFSGDTLTRRQVSFSIAMVALSAKMAKADGIVTSEEIDAFRDIFQIPDDQAGNVSRLYNLAKQDVAGYESYARQVKDLFPDDEVILEYVLDGLFHIAKADGVIHEMEQGFLDRIAEIFVIAPAHYRRIKLRHVEAGAGDAYLQLDASSSWDDETLKQHFRTLVKDNHPDRLIARGVPEEFIAIANERLAAINAAWETVRAERGI
ncbi:MAG: molecular chaperone DjiA [Pseudomonadota bacterium]|nr:molecular chaperone DjiA [Pseudomonadota bacterium]